MQKPPTTPPPTPPEDRPRDGADGHARIAGGRARDERRPAWLDDNWANFGDRSISEAYRLRPPYPEEIVRWLVELSGGGAVAELGCGTGELARRLAPRVQRVDAIDASASMIDVGRGDAGGAAANLSWHCSRVEDHAFAGPYALAFAAGSLHWMQWDRLFPRLRAALSEPRRLVVISGARYRTTDEVAWERELVQIVYRHWTYKRWRPFDTIARLVEAGFLAVEDERTATLRYTQCIDDYIQHFHSQAALSIDRMGPAAVAAFDTELRALVRPYADARGHLGLSAQTSFVIGRVR